MSIDKVEAMSDGELLQGIIIGMEEITYCLATKILAIQGVALEGMSMREMVERAIAISRKGAERPSTPLTDEEVYTKFMSECVALMKSCVLGEPIELHELALLLYGLHFALGECQNGGGPCSAINVVMDLLKRYVDSASEVAIALAERGDVKPDELN